MRWSFVDAHFDNQFTVLQLVHILASYLNVHHKKNAQKRGIIGWKPQWIPWFCWRIEELTLELFKVVEILCPQRFPPETPPLIFVVFFGYWDVWHSPFWDVFLVEVIWRLFQSPCMMPLQKLCFLNLLYIYYWYSILIIPPETVCLIGLHKLRWTREVSFCAQGGR